MSDNRAAIVAEQLVRGWGLQPPVKLSSPYVRGMTSDVWLAVDAEGDEVVAKLTYDEPSKVEAGLRAAELADEAGVRSGRPRRTTTGELVVSVSTDTGPHPLAALEVVAGDRADLSEPAVDEQLGRMMATIQKAIQHLDVVPFDGLLEYLSDETHEIAFASVLWPAIRQVVSLTENLNLTWGIVYGDGPEPVDARGGGLGLVDWGSVRRAPLLWDVVCGARSVSRAGGSVDRFITGFLKSDGPMPPEEARHIDALSQLRTAELVRFFAWRVHRPEHFAATHEADRRSLSALAAQLGVHLDADSRA